MNGVVDGFNSYAKLGLALNLNPLANGGCERSTDTRIQEPSLLSPAKDTADDEPCIPSGFGRIIRDDTGNIIGFEASKTEERRYLEVAEVEGVQLDAAVVDQAVHQRWAATLSSNGAARIDPKGKRVLRGEFTQYCVNLDFSPANPILASAFFEKLHAAAFTLLLASCSQTILS